MNPLRVWKNAIDHSIESKKKERRERRVKAKKRK
jgi:hypothetical protein